MPASPGDARSPGAGSSARDQLPTVFDDREGVTLSILRENNGMIRMRGFTWVRKRRDGAGGCSWESFDASFR